MQEAFEQVIQRHAALRTTFAVNSAGEPVQQVHEEITLEMPVIVVDEDEIPLLLKNIVRQPFNLSTSLLIRVQLLQVTADDHLLIIVMHHIISDGWSINIFVREISTLYHAINKGYPNPLPELPIQYPDFAAWQRDWLQGEVLAEQISYWQQRLADAPSTLNLPTDFPRPATQSYRGAIYRHTLPTHLTQQVIQFSSQANATPFMTLLAAYQLLLSRYSGQDDIVVGSPIANRSRSEIENLIGFFVNMLTFRAQIGTEDNFNDLLAQVRRHALDGYMHQDVPFEKLVDALDVTRDMSYSPIFQAAFILQNTPKSEIDLGDVTMIIVPAEGATAKYDLTLTVLETTQGFRLLWEYCTDLFMAETIERMATHFVYLLENILTKPKQSVAELPLFSETEQQQILTEWNETKRPFPSHTLTQIFSQQAAKTPDATAISGVDGSLTYAQLDTQSSQLAAYLRQYDLQPDTLIGLALPRHTQMLVAILGILKAGAAYLPIDPAYPAPRIQYMLDHAQAPLLITTSDLQAALPQHQATPILLDSQWAEITAMTPLVEDCSRLDDLAYVIYTSGSTGQPKGVQITQRNLANFLCSMQEKPAICADDTLLAVTTLSFDIATLELYLPLLCGAKILLADQATAKDATLLAQMLDEEPVTLMQATPATWQMLLAAGWQGKAGLTILSGGEALPVTLAQQLLGCGTAVWNMYGPTKRLSGLPACALPKRNVRQKALLPSVPPSPIRMFTFWMTI
ncbi:MAG: condensation domain-containing protein [Chloroflexi bacterium]|nr:condensation domain-containing protein [Chloroflexota bacterium]